MARAARPALCRARRRASCTPFVGGRDRRGRRSRAHDRATPMPASAIPPWRRWSSSTPDLWLHGAVPRPDARLQGRGAAAARPPVRPRAGEARRARHHRRRHLRRYRLGRASRPAATARRSTSSSCIPKGRTSRGAAPADDHGAVAATSHNIAIEGTFDDCQDLVKAMFDDARLPRRACNLSAVNSINWARIAAQIVYYVAAALALGAPDRRGGVRRADRQFRQRLRRPRRRAQMGLPIDAADRRLQPQRHPGALPRDRTT